MINVMICEDQNMILGLLEMFVKSNPDYHVVSKIHNADNALDVLSKISVDLVLMDVLTEDGASGLDATKEIKEKYPKTKVIIVTSLVDEHVLKKAKDVHADSLWYKDVSKEELMDVIIKTMQGEKIFPDSVPQVNIKYATNYDFTRQEKEVLRLLIKGYTYQKIADQIGIKIETVKFHVKNMLIKTGCEDKLELAIEIVKAKCIVNDV